jgi:hypothetical protein
VIPKFTAIPNPLAYTLEIRDDRGVVLAIMSFAKCHPEAVKLRELMLKMFPAPPKEG